MKSWAIRLDKEYFKLSCGSDLRGRAIGDRPRLSRIGAEADRVGWGGPSSRPRPTQDVLRASDVQPLCELLAVMHRIAKEQVRSLGSPIVEVSGMLPGEANPLIGQ